MSPNPFTWDRPLHNINQILGMDQFSADISDILLGDTNVMMFGARDTGKTTFISKLLYDLANDKQDKTVISINLQRVTADIDIISCIYEALDQHPNKNIRRKAKAQFQSLERELGFDLKIIKGSIKKSGKPQATVNETLNQMLLVLKKLSDKKVIIIFDEFQRLNRCTTVPLDASRSALMSSGSNHVSILATGSIRESLELMISNNASPIFGEFKSVELPPIEEEVFVNYIESEFAKSKKNITEEAVEYLVNLTNAHPKRTQELAWEVWQEKTDTVSIEIVAEAFERITASIEKTAAFESVYQKMINGSDSDLNEVRALKTLVTEGGNNLTSRKLLVPYGFSNQNEMKDATLRLAKQGYVYQDDITGEWKIFDPVFAQWLKTKI